MYDRSGSDYQLPVFTYSQKNAAFMYKKSTTWD